MKRFAILLASCAPAYEPNTIPRATALECLDLAVMSEPADDGVVLAWGFGNRCDHRVVVDLASIHVDGLALRDPQHVVALPIGAGDAGVERLTYDGASAPGSIEIEHHMVRVEPGTAAPRHRHAYGAWRLRAPAIESSASLGLGVLSVAPPATTSSGVALDHQRVTAIVPRVRLLRAMSPLLDVGIEIMPGDFAATAHSHASIDGVAMASTATGSAAESSLLARVHTTGDLQVGLELATGVRNTSIDTLLDDGTRVGNGRWSIAIEGRADVTAWITRFVTLRAAIGTNALERGDLVGGIDLALHFAPYDGR